MEDAIILFDGDNNDEDLFGGMGTTQIDLGRTSSAQLRHLLKQSEDETVATLVHNIASYLTFSDVASLGSFVRSSSVRIIYNDDNDDDDDGSESTPEDSWAVGVELDGSNWSIDTPPTPAVIAISPGATPNANEERQIEKNKESARLCEDSPRFEKDDAFSLGDIYRERRRRWAQEKITTAVFAHPKPLRSYCVEAFNAAMNIKHQKEIRLYNNNDMDPEDFREPFDFDEPKRQKTLPETGLTILYNLIEVFLRDVPLSVVFDIFEQTGGLGLETTVASFQLSLTTLGNIVSLIGRTTQLMWKTISSFNPLHVLEAMISLQFNAMGKTSEVLASGIQSVATGVGSASSMALYRLSAANLSASRLESSSSLVANGHSRSRNIFSNEVATTKLLKKLSVINDAARVVSYRELEDDTGGLTRQAVCRTRRMMHYTVPLRPFVATVVVSSYMDSSEDELRLPFQDSSASLSIDSACTTSVDEDESPFMCTPQSFPPTPHSRQLVIAQRAQFSDDVIFIARDRLRIHDGLKSEDERTRERSRALEVEKRLAVFACKDLSFGIELTCGRHIATKVGHMYYASTRSMVPVLRSCFVYFEFTVLPQTITDSGIPGHAATLAIGLSTEEMPPNTLVGAWQGSVGLCTTGQILLAGQWCSPANPLMSAYGSGSTVGCLVYLDDESAFETWDGVMVKSIVRFNVNGVTVAQPVSTLPMTGSPATQPSVVPSPTNVAGGGRELPGAAISVLDPTRSAALNLLVPAIEDLYPTVTIQTHSTSVVCRFSTEDIAANTRTSMGAPDSVAVYAVDGSVIFRADE